jgi:hypothetical protein
VRVGAQVDDEAEFEVVIEAGHPAEVQADSEVGDEVDVEGCA